MDIIRIRFLKAASLLLALLLPIAGLAQVTVQSAFNPSVVTPGQSAQYQIIISGANDPALEGAMPQVEGLTLGNRPSVGQNVSIVNGSTTRTLTYSFPARPEISEGSITVPQFRLSIDGTPHFVPAATLRIVPEGERTRGALKLNLIVPEELYVGQTVTAQIELWIRDDMRLHDRTALSMQGDAFVQTLATDDQATQQARVQDGARYQVVTWPALVTPLKAGNHTLHYQMEIAYEDLAQQGRSDANRFFRDPFGMMGRNASRQMLSDSQAIEVKPLPIQSKPAQFTGAIGTFTVTANHTNTQTRVGEPVVVRVSVSGRGNFAQMDPPLLGEAESWRSYPPESRFTQKDTLGLEGTATYEFLLTPSTAGELTSPPVRFNYFDPEAGEYRVVDIAGEPVAVAQGTSPTLPSRPTDSTGASTLPQKKDDLYPIQLLPGPWVGSLSVPFTHPVFWSTQIGIGLILASLIGWRIRRRQAGRQPDAPILARHRREAALHRKAAVAAAQARDAQAFYQHARNALQKAAALRLRHLHPEALDAAAIQRALQQIHGTDRTLPAEIFAAYDATRFGGSVPELEVKNASERLVRAVNQLIKGR